MGMLCLHTQWQNLNIIKYTPPPYSSTRKTQRRSPNAVLRMLFSNFPEVEITSELRLKTE